MNEHITCMDTGQGKKREQRLFNVFSAFLLRLYMILIPSWQLALSMHVMLTETTIIAGEDDNSFPAHCDIDM